MSDTYRDGANGDRCVTCHGLLRQGGAPMVSIRLSDLEEVTQILDQYVNCPDVWGATITRFEQAAGRTVKQMVAMELEKAKAAVALERALEHLPSVDAVDPSAPDPGTPSTRAKKSSTSKNLRGRGEADAAS